MDCTLSCTIVQDFCDVDESGSTADRAAPSRVPAAGSVAFIVAAPVLDLVLFAALALIVGIDVAIVYLVVAFSAAFALALVAERVGIDQRLKPIRRFGH